MTSMQRAGNAGIAGHGRGSASARAADRSGHPHASFTPAPAHRSSTAARPPCVPSMAAGDDIVAVVRRRDGHTTHVRARIAAVTAAVVLLETDDRVPVATPPGSTVSFCVDGHTHDAVVEASADGWVSVTRPDDLVIDESRRVLRVKTRVHANWRRVGGTGSPRAVMVLDLSMGGMRVLAERHPDDVEGARMEVQLDDEVLSVEIRWCGDHDHDLLGVHGVELTAADGPTLGRIMRRIGALRGDPSNWA